MPIYEYKCTNPDCTLYDEQQERLAKIDARDNQTCKTCDQILTRQIQQTGDAHVSWSLWRVSDNVR